MIYQVSTNGSTIGLAAYLHDKKNWLKNPKGYILYRNLDVLKSALRYAGYTDYHSYEIYVKVNDVMVELNKCKKENDLIIFFNGEDKYYVTEDRERRLCNVGYIDFPMETYKKNLNAAFNALMTMKLRKCNWTFSGRVLRFKLFNNTGAINVCTIATLVDINNKRKEAGSKVIPFIKSKRNNSLVVFTDKDVYDNRSVEEELDAKVYDLVAAINSLYANTDVSVKYDEVESEYNSAVFISD